MITIRPTNIDEVNSYKHLVVEDQRHLMTEDVDLCVIKDTIIVGFFISPASNFIVLKSGKFDIDIAKEFLTYMSLDNASIDHRNDVYPINPNTKKLESLPQSDEKTHLIERMQNHLKDYAISDTDIGTLYYLADRGNEQAADVVEWINNIRKLFHHKCTAVDAAEYYDLEFSEAGDIPSPIEDVLADPPRPTPIVHPNSEQVQFFCARNETSQSFSQSKEIITIWDKILRHDPIFELDQDKQSITVNYEGWVELSFKTNWTLNENNRVNVKSWASVDSEDHPETVTYGYMRSSKYVHQSSCSCPSIILNVTKGQVVKIKSLMSYNDSSYGDQKKVSLTYGESVITLKTVPELS